jgi:hypothetical protein
LETRAHAERGACVEHERIALPSRDVGSTEGCRESSNQPLVPSLPRLGVPWGLCVHDAVGLGCGKGGWRGREQLGENEEEEEGERAVEHGGPLSPDSPKALRVGKEKCRDACRFSVAADDLRPHPTVPQLRNALFLGEIHCCSELLGRTKGRPANVRSLRTGRSIWSTQSGAPDTLEGDWCSPGIAHYGGGRGPVGRGARVDDSIAPNAR